jgi:hypothetical protein
LPPKGYRTPSIPEATYDRLCILALKLAKTIPEVILFLIENYEEEHETMKVEETATHV